jgi:hypothetical protein
MRAALSVGADFRSENVADYIDERITDTSSQ